MRKFFLLFLLFLFLSLVVPSLSWAQELEVRARITVQAPTVEPLLEYWNSSIRQVRLQQYLAIPEQRILMTRIGAEVIEVELEKPFRFRYYSEGEAQERVLTTFQISLRASDVEKIMSINEGVLVVETNSNLAKAWKFVEAMKADGITSQIYNYIKSRRSPLSVYKIENLSFDVDVEKVLNREVAEPKQFQYRGLVVVPNVFSKVEWGSLPRRLDQIGQLIDPKSPLIEAYTTAHKKLVDRIQSLRFRGWWPSTDVLRTRQAMPVDFAGYPNVEPIAPKCHQVFL